MNLTLDPTYICNERCVSCRCNLIQSEINTSRLLSESKYMDIIDEFSSLGGESVSIYGGEPLLWNDLFSILTYSKNKNLITSISTNGTLLNKRNIHDLLATDIDSITISIMGTGNNYTLMHGRPFFNEVVNNIKELIANDDKYKDRLSLHITIQNNNFENFPNILCLAKELGIKNVSTQYVSLVRESVNAATELMLKEQFNTRLSHWNISNSVHIPYERVKHLIEIINSSITYANENGIDLYIDPVFYDDRVEDIISTGIYIPNGHCDLDDIVVLPDGRVGACCMLQHYIIGDLWNMSIKDVFNSPKYKSLKKLVSQGSFLPICSNCCKHEIFYLDR